MHIRPATAADIPGLMDIEAAAAILFRGLNLFDMSAMQVIDPAAHAASIAAGLSLVAELDGQLAGFAIGERQGPDVHLLELDVHPLFQQRGIGRVLLDAFCDTAAAQGAGAVWLSTFRDPPWNAPFYRRNGFTDVPKPDYAPWVHDVEAAQSAWLDLATRVVMRRPV